MESQKHKFVLGIIEDPSCMSNFECSRLNGWGKITMETKRTPKVLLVTTWFPEKDQPSSGIFVKRDALSLSSFAEVEIVHLTQSRTYSVITEENVSGIRVTRVPFSLRNPFSVLKAARELNNHLKSADLLHSHAMSTLIPLSVTNHKLPWIHTEHWSGYIEWDSGWRKLVRYFFAFLSKQPTKLVSVSSVLASKIENLSKREVEVIPNIVEFGAIQERPHWDGKRPLKLIAVGNLIPRKRPLLAAATCKTLNDRGIKTELTWVGEGPLQEDLELYCQQYGVSLCLPGVLDSDAVTEAFSHADVSLFPTAAETFGLVGAEALAAGCPLVAGNNGGQVDFVKPPSGLLIAESDPEKYADGVEAVLQSTQALTATQIAAPIRNEFSVNAHSRRYINIYTEILPHFFTS